LLSSRACFLFRPTTLIKGFYRTKSPTTFGTITIKKGLQEIADEKWDNCAIHNILIEMS
jgi:hypothetical protein